MMIFGKRQYMFGFECLNTEGEYMCMLVITCYNLINNFSIIACGARRARSCATAYLLREHNIPYALGSFALIENYFIRLHRDSDKLVHINY